MATLENLNMVEKYVENSKNQPKSYLWDNYISMTITVDIFVYKDTHIYDFIYIWNHIKQFVFIRNF